MRPEGWQEQEDDLAAAFYEPEIPYWDKIIRVSRRGLFRAYVEVFILGMAFALIIVASVIIFSR